MKSSNFSIRRNPLLWAMLAIFVIAGISSCIKDDMDDLPITNDFRVLQVRDNGETITNGVADISVIAELQLVFSHGVDSARLGSALTVEPSADYDLSFDATGSFATISFTTPLAYESNYTITIPAGVYGRGGQESKSDFIFTFTTAPQIMPAVTLSSDVADLFEGETATVTATLQMAILEDVSMDLVFGGDAEEGNDYSVSAMSIMIPAGENSGSVEITGINDGMLEGAETITVALENLVNAREESPQLVTINLGDVPPSLELKGVMELDNYIDGTDGRVRAIHLRVLEDIPNLGIYGVEIASNGAAPDPMDIDFKFPDMVSASAGDELFIVRDQDEANAAAYFGECFNDFIVFPSDAITQNGDDAILLYNGDVVIESFGEPGVDGTDEYWEYTDSWAYKVGSEWIYAGVNCVENAMGTATNETSACKYPYCSPIELQGALALLWDGSGTNGGKAVHVRINRDIADLSQYALGVANNGGGTDGPEFTFPAMAASEGDHILVAREPATIAAYFGPCYDLFAEVIQTDAMNQNGDDAIELFDGMDVIETYGDANVDGTGQTWEYAGSWGYKSGGSWTYGGVDCGMGSTTTQMSMCPYPFCE